MFNIGSNVQKALLTRFYFWREVYFSMSLIETLGVLLRINVCIEYNYNEHICPSIAAWQEI